MSASYLAAFADANEALPVDLQRAFSRFLETDIACSKLLGDAERCIDEIADSEGSRRLELLQKARACLEEALPLTETKSQVCDSMGAAIAEQAGTLDQQRNNYTSGAYRALAEKAAEAAEAAAAALAPSPARAARNSQQAPMVAAPQAMVAAAASGLKKAQQGAKPMQRASVSGRSDSGGGQEPKRKKPAGAASAAGAGTKRGQKKAASGDASKPKKVKRINKYCLPTCKVEGDQAMVGCDNDNCTNGEWFHYKCVGLTAEPNEEKWFCPSCRPLFKKK